MHNIATNGRLLIIVVLLAIVWSGQADYARADHCTTGIPQWVRERQQYETSYVYASAASSLRASEMGSHIPQWVKDRQQYETGYVYVLLAGSAQPIPQWARDRQQYETHYVYVPQALDVARSAPVC